MQYLSSKACNEIASILNFKIDHMETRGFPSHVDEYKQNKFHVIKIFVKSIIKKMIPYSIKLNRINIINNHDSKGNYHLLLILKNN